MASEAAASGHTGESGEYGTRAGVLAVASPAAAPQWRKAVARAGCRLIDVVEPDAAPDRLRRQIAVDAVLVDAAGIETETAAALIAQAREAARRGRFGCLLSLSMGELDSLGEAATARGVEVLCDSSPEQSALAIGLASLRRPPRLNDVSKARATVRLQQLSEEVGRIASVLAALSEDEDAAAAVTAAAGPPEPEGEPVEAGFVRSIIRARRLRDHFFRGDLFADPAWDMLLDLMAARIERQRVAVSSLCIAAAVPPTTALRWIKTLSDHGLFVRIADPEDGRRVFIELSDEAAAGMEAYLRAAQRIAALIV
jgi:hypothetical protein